MSRTVRKLALGRGHGMKWHPNRFNLSDYNVLKNTPNVKDQNRGQWVRKFGRMNLNIPHDKIEYFPISPFMSIGINYFEPADEAEFKEDKAKYYRLTEYGYWDYTDVMYEKWSAPHEYHKRKIFIPNPKFDFEADKYYLNWFRVHKEVHRNGSCRRQRMHGVALSKKIDHRQKRAQAKQALYKELYDI